MRAPLNNFGLRQLGVLAGTGSLLLACTGCGSVKHDPNPDLIAGKQLFVAKCGSCHTLARAGTKGVVGPNLDEAFRTGLAEGEERNTVRGIVEGQVQDAQPEGAMPKDLTSGATAKNRGLRGPVARPTRTGHGLRAAAVRPPAQASRPWRRRAS